MILEVWHPRPPLDSLIDNFLFYEGYTPPQALERMLPDGGVDLIIDLTDVPKNLYDNSDFTRYRAFRRAWISGVRRGYITIDSLPLSSMMVVRFQPGGAHRFLGLPMDELADRVELMDDFLGSEFFDLRDALLEAGTMTRKFQCLERYFLRRVKDRLAPNPLVRFAIQQIHAAPATATISDIASRTGYSHKHLVQVFTRHVGVSPKEYLRLIRFQAVLQAIEKAQAICWNDLALDCGYYDQSHFIHEFRHFSGLTPTVYLGERGEYLNSLPIPASPAATSSPP